MVRVKRDLTGEKFGHLTVLRQVNDKIKSNGKHEAAWECECDCLHKNKTIVRQSDLIRKDGKAIKSCGKCFHEKVKVEKDLTGETFGMLLVLGQADDYIKPDGKHEAQWLCRCACGNQTDKIVMGCSLTSGNTKSCGCLRQKTSAINGKSSKKYNEYDYSKHYGVGFCSNTGSEFYFDWEDFDKIKDHCWSEHILTSGYHALETNIDGVVTRMNWLIVGKRYDHKDRNPLNNRRRNLRKATFSENAQNASQRKDNTSGITGVHQRKADGIWISYIDINKNRSWLGEFVDKEDAVRARLQAEAKYFGEFAPQRHLFEQYQINENGGDVDD